MTLSVYFIHNGAWKKYDTRMTLTDVWNDVPIKTRFDEGYTWDSKLSDWTFKMEDITDVRHSLKLPFRCASIVEQNPEWQSNLMMWPTAVWDTFIICANERAFLSCVCVCVFLSDVHAKVILVSPYSQLIRACCLY